MGSGVLRVLPPEGLGQQFAMVLSRAVIWGDTHPPKENVTSCGLQNREAAKASLGLDTALGTCQGGEGDSIADPGGCTLRSLQQCVCWRWGKTPKRGKEQHSGGLGAGRVLAAAHRGEVDQHCRPLAWDDVFMGTNSVLGGKRLLQGPECMCLPSPKAKVSWSLFTSLESSQTCAATSLKSC